MDFRTTGPVDILADSVENDRDKNTFTARGNVELREGQRLLSADYVTYNDTTKDVFAEGRVVLQDEGDRMECDRLRLNLDTKQGTLENGHLFIKQSSFYISGGRINKVGEDRYEMRKGEFTTCGWDRPAWKFTATDVDITVDGYATTKSAKFHILDYPVFYFPWGTFPVKTERQSGFLIPEVTLSSRNGAMLNNAYFWAISKDKDATFYVNWIRDRGVNLGAQFRYATREDLKGAWEYFVINDIEYEGVRWQLKGRHEQRFFNDLQLKADIRYVSDRDYLADFGDTWPERAENQLKSTVYLEKPFRKSLMTVEATYFEDLAGGPKDYAFDNQTSLVNAPYFRHLLGGDYGYSYQQLPRVSYFTEYLPILAGKLFTNLTADLTSFYRDNQLVTCLFDSKGNKLYCQKTNSSTDLVAYTDSSKRQVNFEPSGYSDCVYNYYDPQLLGQRRTICRQKGDTYTRLAFEPSLRIPFSVSGINFLVSGTYIGTGYLLKNNYAIDRDASYRNTFRIDGDMNMQFVRTFSTGIFDIGEIQSLIKPQIRYTFVPNTSSRDIPNIDPYDRLNQTNAITYSLNHYLYGIKDGVHRELALFEVSQTYGLSENLEASPLYNGYGNRLSSIDARLTIYPMRGLSYTNETVMSVSGGGLSTMRNNLQYKEPGKYRFSLYHTYTTEADTQNTTLNQASLILGGTYKEFDGTYQLLYSFKDHDWVDALYGVTYRAGCWAVTVALTQTKYLYDTSKNAINVRNTTDTRFTIKFDLTGISGIGR